MGVPGHVYKKAPSNPLKITIKSGYLYFTCLKSLRQLTPLHALLMKKRALLLQVVKESTTSTGSSHTKAAISMHQPRSILHRMTKEQLIGQWIRVILQCSRCWSSTYASLLKIEFQKQCTSWTCRDSSPSMLPTKSLIRSARQTCLTFSFRSKAEDMM